MARHLGLTIRHGPAVIWLVILVASVASEVRAQTTSDIDWQRGTTLSGFVGAASSSSTTDIAGGLSLGWEITPRFGIEGRGVWLGTGDNADAFAATLAALVALDPARPVKPFALAGVGLYRAAFDANASDVPSFYRERMAPGGLRAETFTDFALAFGGGIDFFMNRHLTIRPEVTVHVAMRSSNVHPVTVYGVQLAYHFEDHPITPTRRW